MSAEKNLYELIQRCDICLNGEIISRDLLLKTYAQFISESICLDEHVVGISLHTGSICFDLITIVYVALGCLLYDETTPEDIVNTLEEGDLIIFNGKTRAVFIGIDDNGFVRIRQDNQSHGHKAPITSTIAPQNFYKIKPYKGTATILDGRGIREDNNARTCFIETVFGKDKADISGIVHKSAIIVASRETADMLVRGTVINYGNGKCIQLTELVTASYYTENDECSYLGNPGKTEPVLKLMNQVSLAREHIVEDEDKRIIGLIVLGKQISDTGKSELIGLMGRRSLKYVFICYPLQYDDNKGFLETYPDVKLFACTEEFLLSYALTLNYKEGLIGDLNTKINNILNKKIEIQEIKSGLDWNTYRNLKGDIHFIKNNEYSDENTEYFIIHSFSLLNLYTTAVFPIASMEKYVAEGIIGCLSPKERLNKLEEIAGKFEGILEEKMKSVTDNLQRLYSEISYSNIKYEFIKSRLADKGTGDYIALIVPKAFYKVLLYDQLKNDKLDWLRIEIETIGKFDSLKNYNEIIVVGAFKGKRFSAFSNSSSSCIVSLLHSYEVVLHKIEERKHKETEQFYNRHSYIPFDFDEEQPDEKTEDLFEGRMIEEIDSDLDKYIEETLIKAALNSVENIIKESGTAVMADVVRVARCQDGETIFFSKYYTPYVLDNEQSMVVETNVKNLNPGDTLIFTRYTEQMKDIVDEIIYKMLSSKNVDADMSEAFRKSKHWKQVLKKYMQDNQLSFRNISEEMANYGSPKHEVTLRTWLNEESHIVGPREKDAFYQIALICGDKEMLADSDSFWKACRMIRSLRIRVLKLIGLNIIRSFQGTQNESDELLSIVEEKVNELSQVIQIETIRDVNSVRVPVYLVNRPYSI